MSPGRQVSLFEDLGDTSTPAALNPLAGRTVRRELTDGAWVDLRPGWVTGADELFDRLSADVPWRAEKRQMYDRVLEVPRLVRHYLDAGDTPHPLVDTCRDALTDYYRAELPEGFASAGLCLYRNGNDSVAWHGDTIGRGKSEDTMVAILSLGSPRPLTLRPVGGGQSLRFTLGHGDLLVMGGSCQRTWQHAVPKTTGVGPRVSVQFRPPGVW
ncbi:alpha-ketoglutarate-dependent dioxygenase AlkB [Williamsia sp.]|uniref:alpha-ketoglutarate-dependent dioxygenase AlkB n=1 Tax=Williamsia sp. TaxID=1872085 RepID=UPI002F94731D